MNPTKRLIKFAIVTFIFTGLLLPTACNQVQNSPPGVSENKKAAVDQGHEEIELAIVMGRMQLYMNKLYFSGINNNNELRDFYVHELEEAMDEIVEGNVMDDGVDISQNMEMYGTAQLEVFEKSMAGDKAFKDAYNNLVNACNSCHKASKYPFIIIKEPTNMVFDNQVYTVE